MKAFFIKTIYPNKYYLFIFLVITGSLFIFFVSLCYDFATMHYMLVGKKHLYLLRAIDAFVCFFFKTWWKFHLMVIIPVSGLLVHYLIPISVDEFIFRLYTPKNKFLAKIYVYFVYWVLLSILYGLIYSFWYWVYITYFN